MTVRRCFSVPTLPAASVAETTTVCAPAVRLGDVTDQVRVEDTTTSLATPSTTTLILLPAGTLTRPLIVGVADLVDAAGNTGTQQQRLTVIG